MNSTPVKTYLEWQEPRTIMELEVDQKVHGEVHHKKGWMFVAVGILTVVFAVAWKALFNDGAEPLPFITILFLSFAVSIFTVFGFPWLYRAIYKLFPRTVKITEEGIYISHGDDTRYYHPEDVHSVALRTAQVAEHVYRTLEFKLDDESTRAVGIHYSIRDETLVGALSELGINIEF